MDPIRAERWETLVVGAGPAGLFSALSLVAAGEEVLLVDAGPDVDRRRIPGVGEAAARTEYERGVGGAGLFSDGKLCLSLEVGGHLETELPDPERAELLEDITAVFDQLLEGGARSVRPGDVRSATALAATAGLKFKYYPVAHIGTDRCHDVIVGLRSIIANSGATICPETELVDLQVDSDSQKIATLRAGTRVHRIRAQNVILAMGKIGAEREGDLCRQLGVRLRSQPLYIGLRLEAPAESVAPLFAHAKDPKYSLPLEDGTKVKTHCASEHGEVIALSYSDLPLAGGHNYSWAKTGRSGFSILWDGLLAGDNAYATARDVMRRADRLGRGRLIVQTVSDYRRGRTSSAKALDRLPLSCHDWAAGDVRQVLPDEFFPRMDQFLNRLEHLAPDLTEEAVFYAPAIEWWMQRVTVDSAQMATAVPGLYVAGDGSGWSQGIVHAAATGILAARGIHGEQPRLGDWLATRNESSQREPAFA